MPTFATDIKPASTGLRLGNEIQKWTAYIDSLFVDTVLTNTPNQASTGTFRLASSDSIAWRNSANTADVLLSKTVAASGTTPADTLVFTGDGIEGPIISHNLNPASAGEIRLASTDAINFRNNANTADIAGLVHNSDDTITVGGSAGASINGSTAITGNLTVSGNESVSGSLSAASVATTLVNGGGIAGLSLTTSNVFPTTGNSSAIIIASGAAGGTSGNSGNINLNAGTVVSGTVGTLVSNTKFSTYNGLATVKKGMASEVATVDLTAQTAAITTTTLYTPAGDGQYRLSWSAKVTTAAGTSSTLGALTIVYTDPDGVAITLTAAAVIAAGTVATTSTGNTTGTVLLGIPQYLNCKAATVVSYAFAYVSNAAAAMNFNLHILLEAM